MIAVHFGAGNIGRGFIGVVLAQSGYEVCFVDVNDSLVNMLNEKRSYRIIRAGTTREEMKIENIWAINSRTDKQKVVELIARSDLVTTAVGVKVLPLIAELIAEGLRKRIWETKKPINIIACENSMGASSLLKEKVYGFLTDQEKVIFEQYIGFPDAVVDCIVPNQLHDDLLTVVVEPYYEWIVDETRIVNGEKLLIRGITYTDNITAYLERKLFTVNTGHAITAYLGYARGRKTIKEAIDDPFIFSVVRNVMNETGLLLISKYGFDADKHAEYIKRIIERFQNPHITDEVMRVARSPIRKLGPNERLISPARQLLARGMVPHSLAIGIAAALAYNYTGDEEAVQLQRTISHKGIEGALFDYASLPRCDKLVQLVREKTEWLKHVLLFSSS